MNTKLIIKKQAKAECTNKQFTACSNSFADLRKLLRISSLTSKVQK